MAMKSPPGSITTPAECRDLLQILPRTRVRDDGTSGSSFCKIMAALTFLGLKEIYRRRRATRRDPTGRGGPHPRVHLDLRQVAAPALWASPLAPLRSGTSHPWAGDNLPTWNHKIEHTHEACPPKSGSLSRFGHQSEGDKLC